MRRTALLAAAAAVLFTAPAFAGDLMTGGFPMSNSNLGVVSNTAAGAFNKAQQSVTGIQAVVPGAPGGFGGFGGLNSNLGSASNVAAGVGNTAQQQIGAFQFGGAKGGFNSNLGTVSNMAVGVGNTAQQHVIGIQ